MGRGIAQVALAAGIEVIIADASAALTEKGAAELVAQLGRLASKGKLPDADALVKRLRPAARLEELAEADFVVEAAVEESGAKQAIFAELDRICRPGVILASNTSSISITALAARAGRPERVIGMHFMNPVPLMKLVEVIRG